MYPGSRSKPSDEWFTIDQAAILAAQWTDVLSNWAGLSTYMRSGVGAAPFPENRGPQACRQWLSVLTRQHVVQEVSEGLPAHRSVLDESDYFRRMNEADRAAIRYALERPAPRLTTYDVAVMGLLFQALDTVWAGRATIEEALARAQAKPRNKSPGSSLRQPRRPPPPLVRPVPSPTPEQAPVVVAFFTGEGPATAAHHPWADLCNGCHPDASVTIEQGPPFDFGATAASSDCFVWPTFARPSGWQQHVIPLQPFLDAESALSLDDLYARRLPSGRHRTPNASHLSRQAAAEALDWYASLAWVMPCFGQWTIPARPGRSGSPSSAPDARRCGLPAPCRVIQDMPLPLERRSCQTTAVRRLISIAGPPTSPSIRPIHRPVGIGWRT